MRREVDEHSHKHDAHDHHDHEHHHHGGGGAHLHFDAREVLLNKRRRILFGIGSTLTAILVATLFYIGITSHSIALLMDAVHNLTDLTGQLMALGAMILVMRPPTIKRTFGYQRAGQLAAVLNQLLLLVSTGVTCYEAYRRLGQPPEVHTTGVFIAAAVGIAINGGIGLLLYSDRKRSVHSESAVTHMLGDAGLAVGVMVSAAVIHLTGWYLIDPLVSIGMSVFIVWRSLAVLWECINLMLDRVPANVDVVAVDEYLSAIPGVIGVHGRYVWALSDSSNAVIAHLVLQPGQILTESARSRLVDDLRRNFHLHLVTIQTEYADPDYPCYLQAPA
jgi:cobalt-zinc-cadmium efflux system protein